MQKQIIDYAKIKSIHFVGIKGVGITPLAIIAKEAGFSVTGSDLADIFITDESLQKAQIPLRTGFSSDAILQADLVITTGAHGGFDNIEVKAAREKEIPVITQGEAVGLFMQGDIFQRNFFGISVAGCHGKTTTSAMIATMFAQSSLDPSYAIGTSNITPLGVSGHFGSGKYFIAEADEYATEPKYDHTPKFLWQHPDISVVTNIEHDHPDLYLTIDDVREAYMKFIMNGIASLKDGPARNDAHNLLIAFGDDEQVQKILEDYSVDTITYGFSSNNDYIIHNVSTENGQTVFQIDSEAVTLGEFTLNVLGEHNALNAAAATIVGLECGLSLPAIQQGLLAFRGTKRRFEIIGRLSSGALLIDDYAHHPTEIKKTLRAAWEQFKKLKIVCIFQPHTYSRTKLLFEEFSSSFISADEVILTDIYPSAREAADPSVSSELLAQSIRKCNRDVLYLSKLADVVKYVKQRQWNEEYVIITMGAGDIYKIGEELL